LGIDLEFSTAFHPQTDGQSERANRTLEEVLRHFVSPRQDGWDDWLDMAEHAINNSVSPSTGYTPLFLCYGHNPLCALDVSLGPVLVPAAQSTVEDMHAVLQHAEINLHEPQQRMMAKQNAHRRDVTFAVGDMVRLSTANLSLPSSMTKKLTGKYLGPFAVEQVISPVGYRLHLPNTINIHPVFMLLCCSLGMSTRICRTLVRCRGLHLLMRMRIAALLTVCWISGSASVVVVFRLSTLCVGVVMAWKTTCGSTPNRWTMISLLITRPATTD
jgi:hypothetical protein